MRGGMTKAAQEAIDNALQSGAAKDTTPRPILSPEEAEADDKLSEKAFQADVVKFAKKHGWDLIYHTFDSRKSASGFPDLVMVRNGVVIFAELKSATGKTTPAQDEWLAELRKAETECCYCPKNIRVLLWRPQDWPEIVRILT